jgi:hypothetical protein
MAQTIYTIVTTDYSENNFGTTKKVSTKSFSDKQTAEEYFRNSIVEKAEKLDFDRNELYFPLGTTYYSLREDFSDESLDDWFEMQIFETTLD